MEMSLNEFYCQHRAQHQNKLGMDLMKYASITQTIRKTVLLPPVILFPNAFSITVFMQSCGSESTFFRTWTCIVSSTKMLRMAPSISAKLQEMER